jgi:hypothetical protein
VPLVAISRWAKLGYVSHVVHDHTAITRFVEAIFDLPALTGRDANSAPCSTCPTSRASSRKRRPARRLTAGPAAARYPRCSALYCGVNP